MQRSERAKTRIAQHRWTREEKGRAAADARNNTPARSTAGQSPGLRSEVAATRQRHPSVTPTVRLRDSRDAYETGSAVRGRALTLHCLSLSPAHASRVSQGRVGGQRIFPQKERQGLPTCFLAQDAVLISRLAKRQLGRGPLDLSLMPRENTWAPA